MLFLTLLTAGKSVGIISTDSLVGASPSSAYAHAAHRNWRTDGEVRADDPTGQCKDITRQLVEDNIDIQVCENWSASKLLVINLIVYHYEQWPLQNISQR